MSGDSNKNIDRKLSASLSRFGLRGRGSSSRLPSLKPARDLTLGGTPKRTFTPNLVARSTKKEESYDEPGPSNRRNQKNLKPKTRGRGRGRGEIISSAGIFSQGPAVQKTLASVFGGGSYGGFGGGERSGGGGGSGGASSSSRNIHTTKGENEDELVSDQVFDMLKDEGKIEWDEEDVKMGNLAPITLPLASRLSYKTKDEVKIEKMDTDEEHNETKNINSSDKLAANIKPISKNISDNSNIELNSLFTGDDAEGKLFFFQFPDALPIRLFAPDDPTVKQESGVLKEQEKIKDENIEEQLKNFTFDNVSEGVIGKLQIYESGKVKVRLGNVYLDVCLGTPCGFLQDLISVQTERNPPEMICLGHINHRLIAVPDYTSLLGERDVL